MSPSRRLRFRLCLHHYVFKGPLRNPLTSSADHAHHCCRKQIIARHNGLRDHWISLYQQAGWQALEEQWVPELARATPVRADIRASGTAAEPLTYCDVKVTHVVRWHGPTSTWRGEARGAAAAAGEAEKLKIYEPSETGSPVRIVPLVFETAGRWGEAAARELRRVARARACKIARTAVDPDAVYRATLTRWRRELSTLLQRANTTVVMASAGCAVSLHSRGPVVETHDLIPEAH